MEIFIATFFGTAAAVGNLLFLWYWRGVEKRESDAGRIPSHKLVSGNLSVRVGDRYAVSVMDFAITFILYTRGLPPAQTLMVCVVIGLVWAALSQTFWFFKKNPDSLSLDKLRVSRVGLVHLPYYGVQYTAGFMGLVMVYYMMRGAVPWSPMVIVGLGAAGAYFLTHRSTRGSVEAALNRDTEEGWS